MATPLQTAVFRLTPEQIGWLDRHNDQGLSRSAALRLVLQQAIEQDRATRGKARPSTNP